MNYRGCGGVPLKTSRLFNFCDIEDFSFIIDKLKEKYPNSSIVSIGVSLGATYIFRYLAGPEEKIKLDAGFVVSACFDFEAGRINTRRNLFRRQITRFKIV